MVNHALCASAASRLSVVAAELFSGARPLAISAHTLMASAWAQIWIPRPGVNSGGYHDQVELDGLGDYSAGRWVWLFSNIKEFPQPIPATGRQGFWNWLQATD